MSQHARLAPSGASRWMACPGSVPLTSSPGAPAETTSDYAEEGTHAHAALEYAIENRQDPMELVDSWFYDRDLTEETARAIKVAYDYVMNYVNAGKERGLDVVVHAERQYSSGRIAREDCWGTGDIVVVHPEGKGLLEIIDYKHGAGVPVEIEGNRQLQIYLEGAIHDLEMDRDAGGYNKDQIDQFCMEIREAAARTDDPQAPVVPGETQCRWCRVKPVCPALAQSAMTEATQVFPAAGAPQVPVETLAQQVEDQLFNRDASELTPTQIARIVQVEPMISGWLKAVRDYAIAELKDGREVPGYKLVAGRKARKWDAENDAMLKLLASKKRTDKKAIGQDGASTRQVLSPAQAEAKIKPHVSPKTWKNIAEHISVSEGNPVLAPATDSRPAITRANPEEVFGDAAAVAPEDLF